MCLSLQNEEKIIHNVKDGSIDAPDHINKSNNNESLMGDVGFLHAFLASLSVILVSELGDKTFFIAAIMAMRHPRLIVFAGAIAALALMTVLSGKLHSSFHFFISSKMKYSFLFQLTHY